MRRTALLLIAALSCIAPPPGQGHAQGRNAAFTGRAEALAPDMLSVEGRLVRLWGVTAPPAERLCPQGRIVRPCGEQAVAALERRLRHHEARCRPIRREAGRIVARCTVLAADLGGWMTRQGWTLDLRRESGGRYADDEASARRARRGLWAEEGTAPPAGRRR